MRETRQGQFIAASDQSFQYHHQCREEGAPQKSLGPHFGQAKCRREDSRKENIIASEAVCH